MGTWGNFLTRGRPAEGSSSSKSSDIVVAVLDLEITDQPRSTEDAAQYKIIPLQPGEQRKTHETVTKSCLPLFLSSLYHPLLIVDFILYPCDTSGFYVGDFCASLLVVAALQAASGLKRNGEVFIVDCFKGLASCWCWLPFGCPSADETSTVGSEIQC